jgi:hypothetical protein
MNTSLDKMMIKLNSSINEWYDIAFKNIFRLINFV